MEGEGRGEERYMLNFNELTQVGLQLKAAIEDELGGHRIVKGLFGWQVSRELDIWKLLLQLIIL